MIKIVGLETGKVYAKGYKNDCFRQLKEQYPSSVESVNHRNRKDATEIYPEPLQIKQIPKYRRNK